MEEILENWIELHRGDFSSLAKDSHTVHHAAQFIAYAAKHLIDEKKDDSHTAAYWIPDKNMLAGHKIKAADGDIVIALNYPELQLLIINESLETMSQKEVLGNTKQDLLEWMAVELNNFGLITSHLDGKMHYDIPTHETEQGMPFQVVDKKNLEELAHYQTNGHMVLSYFASKFATANEVMVWPHHFDEGVYIPVSFENESVIQSIGLGLAVPDTYYDNPYFYVITWEKAGMDYGHLPELRKAGKWHTQDWTGQVLEAKEIVGLRKEAQAETTIHFMENAIQNAMDLLSQ
jgi:hypothetical protein